MLVQPARLIIKPGALACSPASAGDSLDDAQFQRLTAEIAALVARGHECLVVTSGAVGAGMMVLGVRGTPRRYAHRPGVCRRRSVAAEMHVYETHFAPHGLAVAQLLLTHQDLDSRTRYANAQNTLNRLLEHRRHRAHHQRKRQRGRGRIALWRQRPAFGGSRDPRAGRPPYRADERGEGLTHTPDGRGEPIPVVTDVDMVMHLASGEKGRLSTGGMATKLQAVKRAVGSGYPGRHRQRPHAGSIGAHRSRRSGGHAV